MLTTLLQNHFSATSVGRHKIMSSHLNKELREKYQVGRPKVAAVIGQLALNSRR